MAKQVKPKIENKINTIYGEPINDRVVCDALTKTMKGKIIMSPKRVGEDSKKEFVQYTDMEFFRNNLGGYSFKFKKDGKDDFIAFGDLSRLIECFLSETGVSIDSIKEEYKRNLKQIVKEIEDIKKTFLYDN